MSDWGELAIIPARVSIGDLAREVSVRNSSRSVAEVRSVTNNRGLVPTSEYFENTRTSADTSAYKVVSPGMFVYNPSRVNVGSIAWHKESNDAIVSPMYVVFEVDASRVLPEYLLHFLLSVQGRRQIATRTEVGARFRLTFAALSKIEIPIPSIALQMRTIAALNGFFDLDKFLQREIELRALQMLTVENGLVFTEPTGPRLTRIGDVADLRVGFPFKSGEFSEDPSDESLIRGDNIGQGVLKQTDFKRWKRTVGDGLDKFELKANDIVLAMDRPWITAGLKWAQVDQESLPSLLVQRVARLRAHEGKMHQSYLSFVIGSAAFTSYVLRVQSGNTVPHISGGQIADFTFALPPLAEQESIAGQIASFGHLAAALAKERDSRSKQLEYVRDKLLSFRERAS